MHWQADITTSTLTCFGFEQRAYRFAGQIECKDSTGVGFSLSGFDPKNAALSWINGVKANSRLRMENNDRHLKARR